MEGYLLDANDAFISMLGYDSLDELTGTYKDYTPEKWHQYELQIIESQVLVKGSSDEYEKEYIHKDGSTFPISLKTWLIIQNDKPVGMWAIVRDISKQKNTEAELRQMLKQMELFNKHLQDAREEERAGIASAIHDELGQSMTALKLDLGWMLDNLKGQSLIRQKLEKMLMLAESTIKEVQRISAELRPGVLDNLGLVAAIEWHCSEFQQRSGIRCNLNLNQLPEIEKEVELALFRIFQEALTNVIRHSKAGKVEVTLDCNPREILLYIADDGIGIKKDDLSSGKSFGLIGMRERVSYFNGKIEFINHSGTTVKVSIPLKK
jgi:PAS domain S-box-containing protein